MLRQQQQRQTQVPASNHNKHYRNGCTQLRRGHILTQQRRPTNHDTFTCKNTLSCAPVMVFEPMTQALIPNMGGT